MGVSNNLHIYWKDSDLLYSITRLMGDSFKLHSQALVGYEDAMASHSEESTPAGTPQPAAPQLEMETTVY